MALDVAASWNVRQYRIGSHATRPDTTKMIHRDVLHLLRDVRRSLGGDVSLEALARRAGWSPFHLHRAFRRIVGETPKQYTQRVRLERAAARLVATKESVLRVALGAGFASHEVFARAFRRRFGCSPARYRRAALRGASAAERERHAAFVDATAPCTGLYRVSLNPLKGRPTMPMLTIARRELTPQPMLFMRRRCARDELSKAIGECLGGAFGLAQLAGHAIGGRPFTRYPSIGAGLVTIEAGCPVATPAPGEGEVEAGFLQGGPAAVAMHAGSYDELPATYAAMERWMEENSYRPGGAPWESYITDPAEHPNPADWRTEIYWPLAER
jgi:AraC-like DNA-binding protein/effector-binding domain-containing protein